MRVSLGFAVAFLCFCGSASAQSNVIASDSTQVSKATRHELLDLICPGHVVAHGCSACPKDTWDHTQGPSGEQAWDLRAITFGHFLRPASNDVLLSGLGCEPNAGGQGGTFLLTKRGSIWRKVRYIGGAHVEDCKRVVASDGRDDLICAYHYERRAVAGTSLYLLDVGRDPKELARPKDWFFDVGDTAAFCDDLSAEMSVSGNIESVSFVPESSKHVRIVVTGQWGQADVPDEILKACRNGAGPAPDVATVQFRREFLFDGNEVQPAPGGQTEPPITSYSIPK